MMMYERAAKKCHFLFFFRKKIIQKIQIDFNFFRGIFYKIFMKNIYKTLIV